MACVGAREHKVTSVQEEEGTGAGCFGSKSPVLDGVDAWWLVSRDSQAHGKVRIKDGC